MAPTLSFRGQPFREEDTVAAFLDRALGEESLLSLTVVTAWARFGGLGRLEPALEAFRGRGGRFDLVVGIDEGGATMPGLRLALTLADRAFVFHDRGARTFHPKLFLAEGPEKALLLVGSSNVTAGGLFTNYEASLEAEFELPREATEEALAGAKAYVETLLGDEELCLPLDEQLLDRLVSDPRYRVSARDRRPVDRDGQVEGAAGALFGTSRQQRVSAPPLSAEAKDELRLIEAEVEAPAPALSWTKRSLRPSNVEQSPAHQVGCLRLGKAGHDIECQTWFRYELFGAEAWLEGSDDNENPKETARVPFEVTIGGEAHGVVELEVDHAPHRESGQDNHATLMRWGELRPVLRATDYTGGTLTIQRLADGSYLLDISR